MSSEDEGEAAAPFDLLERAERGLVAAPDSDDGCVCVQMFHFWSFAAAMSLVFSDSRLKLFCR